MKNKDKNEGFGMGILFVAMIAVITLNSIGIVKKMVVEQKMVNIKYDCGNGRGGNLFVDRDTEINCR